MNDLYFNCNLRTFAHTTHAQHTHEHTCTLNNECILTTRPLCTFFCFRQRAAFEYGTAVGTAFQLVDDVLDFEGAVRDMGKAPLADLKLGLTTAPVLFAQEASPRLRELAARNFDGDGDVDEAAGVVHAGDALPRTRALAASYGRLAVEALLRLEPSEERNALIHLVGLVVRRKF